MRVITRVLHPKTQWQAREITLWICLKWFTEFKKKPCCSLYSSKISLCISLSPSHTHIHTHNTVAFENSLHEQGRNAIMRGHLLPQNICLTVWRTAGTSTVHVMNFDWFQPIISTERDTPHKNTHGFNLRLQLIQLGFINNIPIQQTN